MSEVRFDESRFPLVIGSFGATTGPEEFEAFLTRLSILLARGRHAFVLDASQAGPLPALLRRRQAAWNAENTTTIIRRSAGVAIVTTSTLVRGTVTAIHWLHPPPYPFTIVATRAEGEAWCLGRLQRPMSGSRSQGTRAT